MGVSIPSLLSGSSSLGKRSAYWILASLGGILAATMLLDVYVDWVRKGEPLWASLLENAVPLALALTVVYVGQTVYQRDGEPFRLAEMAKWALIGCVGIVLLSGSVIWLHVFPQHIHLGFFVLQLGTVGAVAGLWVGHNIAGVRQAKERMQSERDRLQRLFDGIPSPVVHGTYNDGELNILSVNSTFEKHFGVSDDDIRGQNLYDLIVPDDRREEAAEIERRALQEGRAEAEVQRLTTEGPEDFQVYVARARENSSETYAIYADITRQKAREKELQQSTARLEALYEKSPVMINLHDAEGRILDPNPRLLERTGYSEDEITEMKVWDIDQEISRQEATALWDGMETGDRVEREGAYRCKDGTVFPIEIHIRRLDLEGEDRFMVISRDITDQKSREQDLRLFQELIEQTKDSVLVTEAEPLDEPGPRILYVNPAFEEMTGYRREELQGKTPRILQGPDTDREVLDSLRAALETGKSWSGETVNYRKDGTPFFLRWSIAPVRDVEGTIEYWVSVQRDVTQQREREERLRRQKSLLGQTQQLAGAWVIDLRSGEVSASERVYQIHEVEPEADLDMEKVLEFYPSEVRPKVLEAFERCVREGEPYDLEIPLITAKGNRRWIRTVGAPAAKKNGKITKVAGAFQNITKRKEAEEELREERNLLRRILETSPAAIVRLDRQGQFVQASGRAEEVLGLEKEGVTDRTYDDPDWGIEAPDGSPMANEDLPFAQVMSTGEPVYDFEHAIVWPDGTRRLLSVSGAPLRSAGGELEGAVFHLDDITEQRKHEGELVKAKVEAEEASRLKSAMLANMSHEIRTPLTSILGFSEVLEQNLEGHRQAFAKRIRSGGERLRRTLESVLHLSTLEAGVQNLECEEVSLGEVTHDVAGMLEDHATDKSLILQVKTPRSPVVGVWNEDAVHRICRNLVENAIKFTPEGGRVEVRVSAEESHAVLEVEDSGIGMEPDTVSELFKAFKQESEGMDRNYEGSGLGLSIVKRLVEELAGTISVDTEKGEGTCFTVRLPRGDGFAEPEDQS